MTVGVSKYRYADRHTGALPATQGYLFFFALLNRRIASR